MKIIGEIIVGLGLGVVPPLAVPESAPAPKSVKVPCICGQATECKCEEGKCPGGCPVAAVTAWYGAGGYDVAAREAVRTGKTVVLLFTDPVGCVPCRAFAAGALADPAVVSAMRGTINVVVDVRTADGSAMAGRFGVGGWPRMLVYRAGKLKADKSGNVSAAEVLSAIK